jgi:hypothetical protein
MKCGSELDRKFFSWQDVCAVEWSEDTWCGVTAGAIKPPHTKAPGSQGMLISRLLACRIARLQYQTQVEENIKRSRFVEEKQLNAIVNWELPTIPFAQRAGCRILSYRYEDVDLGCYIDRLSEDVWASFRIEGRG